MYDGTLYGHWQAIVTFQQMIVLCDSDGVIDMTPQSICARTGIPLEIIVEGIKVLEEPDPYSRTPGDEGRRILRLDAHRPWGWKIVNYNHYRLLVDAETVKAQNRERQKKHREKVSQDVTGCHAPSQVVTLVTPYNTGSRQAEVEAEADKSKNARKRASRLPIDFTADLEHAETAIPEIDAEAEFARFRDYWTSKSGANGTKADWPAVWRNWIRTCSETGRYARRTRRTFQP